MRKILLATTALVGVVLSGAAHAASTAPISLNVGGYTDFVAGLYHEAAGTTPGLQRNNHDFETEYKINFDAIGKASNGIEYGANISLWNGPEVTNLWTGGGNTVELNSAYVWLSGAFGKVMMGDEHGATDLFVYAPTIGEGQVDGRYLDFVSPFTLARMYASGIDNTEHSTKITYYTPKVGNDMNKVQAGVSYAPNMYDYGSNNVKFNNVTTSTTGLTNNSLSVSPYQDVVKGAVEYTGNFHPVNVAASAQILNGESSHVAMSSTTLGGAASGGGLTDQAANGLLGQKAQDFTAFGVGAQVGFAGFTVGGSYNDMGRYDTVHGQNKSQQNFTLGGKYEFDKVAVAANWLNGEGYDNLLTHAAGDYYAGSRTNTNYVSNFNAYGAGASYTWFPGMSSNVDGVLFNQAVDGQRDHNDGYVLLVSQKLAF